MDKFELIAVSNFTTDVKRILAGAYSGSCIYMSCNRVFLWDETAVLNVLHSEIEFGLAEERLSLEQKGKVGANIDKYITEVSKIGD